MDEGGLTAEQHLESNLSSQGTFVPVLKPRPSWLRLEPSWSTPDTLGRLQQDAVHVLGSLPCSRSDLQASADGPMQDYRCRTRLAVLVIQQHSSEQAETNSHLRLQRHLLDLAQLQSTEIWSQPAISRRQD